MSALIPLHLRNLGATLPLPDQQSVRLLARHELLSPWCQRRLLEELAGVELPPEAGDDPSLPPLEDNHTQLLAYARRCGLDSLDDLETWRRARGLSLVELEQLVAFENGLARASHWIWSQELPGLFLQRRGDFDQVVLTMVRVRDPDLATELFFQLQEGECTFHELVERHADEADRLRRGVVGPVPVNRLNPLLMRVVRRYQPGELIPPLDVNGVVHLIRVDSLQAGRLDEQVRGQLLDECRNRWQREQLLLLRDRLMQLAAPLEAAPLEAAS